MSDNVHLAPSRKRKLGSLGYPYEAWSDSESESEMEEYKMCSKKRQRVVIEEDNSPMSCITTKPVTQEYFYYDEKLQALKSLGVTLRRYLVTVQSEVDRLSPKHVRPNLNMLKLSLDKAKDIIAFSLARPHLPPNCAEMTASLKSQLIQSVSVARKLHVPSFVDSRLRKSVTSHLNDAKRYLNMAMHLAETLHAKVETLSRSVPMKPSSASEECKKQDQPITHWKPSLKTPFFLKPSTLVFKGMTPELVQSLTKALTSDKTKLKKALPIVVKTTQTSPSSSVTCSSKSTKHRKPTHWKPSMNVPFFLKPATFVYKRMTTEQFQTFTQKLLKGAKPVGTSSSPAVTPSSSGVDQPLRRVRAILVPARRTKKSHYNKPVVFYKSFEVRADCRVDNGESENKDTESMPIKLGKRSSTSAQLPTKHCKLE